MAGTEAVSKKKVLVIEDDSFVRQYLCHVFSSMDFETIEAANGEIGVELFKSSPPDIIVTDINMPGKNGFQAIAEIRQVNPHVKIIAISGGGYTDKVDNLDEAKKLGADWVLKKPFLPADIQKIVKEC